MPLSVMEEATAAVLVQVLEECLEPLEVALGMLGEVGLSLILGLGHRKEPCLCFCICFIVFVSASILLSLFLHLCHCPYWERWVSL